MRDLRELDFEYSANHLTIVDYNAFLREYNLTLPESYKEFILFKNGGYTRLADYISEGDPEQEYTINHFFRIEPVETFQESINKNTTNVRNLYHRDILKDIFPQNFYPFASGEGSAYYCINMDDFKIYKKYATDDLNEGYITSSFEVLINGLEDIPIE